MPLAFMVLGFMLVLAGLLFAFRGIGTAAAGADAAKSFSVQGPSWLILVAIGSGVIVFGGWQWKQDKAAEVPPTTVVETTIAEPFDYGDDPDLDLLYDECEAGIMVSCDDLYAQAPVDSNYEAFGSYCGYFASSPTEGDCISLPNSPDISAVVGPPLIVTAST